APTTQEHVTQEGGKMAALMHKLRHAVIADTMIETVKGDMSPGTSAMVLLSSDAKLDAVVHAFEGRPMELVRTDLSVPELDRLRRTVSQIRQRDGGDAPI